MDILNNPYRGAGLDNPDLAGIPYPSTDAETPLALIARCPEARETPLVTHELFGTRAWIKDESGRMGLGSFKALGAAYVIAHLARETGATPMTGALRGRTFVTSSAGNHGLSVAAGARVFGARGVIYLSHEVPEGFARRLEAEGAEVVREGRDYAASMEAAQRAARENDWTLLLDTSWGGYTELPHRLMEGYLVMAAEAARQIPEPPTHILLQAGVGGLAGALAAYFRKVWGDDPRIVVVEPDRAPALHHSIREGRSVLTEGATSDMGRLDCKEPSLIALKGLARDADAFALISEEEAFAVLEPLEAIGLPTSTSGGAGLAALAQLEPGPDARVLAILSEGPA
ncbi:pyridoxal-phosphate dependent enzyme [Roseovarius sp. SCSIO 43702]|uniref:pyridoxal-phosphate dependent enzyme n=1 Tax=Roseovarius sp. SCSIO 43702 TaxID=2823043 RepID=UPI001C72F5CE|nr:pyridoxal-phosphate dependent enzyme [Roseovarius sp. SCSIO 43702]QYX55599.1 pyridoxal-phosphate dependent enzyme [Roseovarius sp. SCSIO 43702]